jgi:NADH-quinone oxidoreductase E subunit
MITEEIREEILRVTSKYHLKKSAVMDALMLVQKHCDNNLTRGDMVEIAEILGIQPKDVQAVASFYTMYNYKKPVGKFHIQVCRNISCALLDAERIIAHLEDILGIKTGSTTEDGLFTLSTVECLGSCGTAPMMQINDDYYESLTEEKVDEIIARLRDGG